MTTTTLITDTGDRLVIEPGVLFAQVRVFVKGGPVIAIPLELAGVFAMAVEAAALKVQKEIAAKRQATTCPGPAGGCNVPEAECVQSCGVKA